MSQVIEYKTYYDQEKKQLKEKMQLDPGDSSLNGFFVSYFQSGHKMAEGHYTRNVADSIWIYYFQNGNKSHLSKF